MGYHKFLPILMLLMSIQTNAGFFSGNDLAKRMSEDNVFDSGVYSGYIIGIVDAAVTRKLICPPPDITIMQAKAIVAKFLKENPELWNTNADLLVLVSLGLAFPCGK